MKTARLALILAVPIAALLVIKNGSVRSDTPVPAQLNEVDHQPRDGEEASNLGVDRVEPPSLQKELPGAILDPSRGMSREEMAARGIIDRSTFGPGYDEVIRAVALKDSRSITEAQHHGRVASFCGFSSPEELAVALDGNNNADLINLLALSESISREIPDFVSSAWERDVGVYMWDPNDTSSRPTDMQYTANSPEGLFRFSSSSRVGDRIFKLMFNSNDHPVLENKLLNLQSLKSHYWGTH